MRSIDGEVVSKLRLEKKKRTAKLCGAKFMLHALLEEYLPMRTRPARSRKKDLCVPQGLPGMPMASSSRGLRSRRRGGSPKNGRTSSRKRLIYDAGFRVNHAAVPTIQVRPPSSKSLD